MFQPSFFGSSLNCTLGIFCITNTGLPLTPKKQCCFCFVAVRVSVASVSVSVTVSVPVHFRVTVSVSAVLSFAALTLAANILALAVDNATPVDVVVEGALINVARLALVASTLAPINTLPAVVPMTDTKVNVTPPIVIGSVFVGCVAKDNTAVQVRLLDT